MKRYKIQELNALEREMRAVARGERSPPADAANRRPILDEDYRGNSPDPHRQRPPRRTRRDRVALGRLHRHSRRRQARRPCDVETYEERRWPVRSRAGSTRSMYSITRSKNSVTPRPSLPIFSALVRALPKF